MTRSVIVTPNSNQSRKTNRRLAMTTKKLLTVLSFALVGTTACAVSTEGTETVGQAKDGLEGCASSGTRFYVPPANDGAKAQIKDLKKRHQRKDAELIQKMVETPQAVWLTKGTP